MLRRFFRLPQPADRCVERGCRTPVFDDGRCWYCWNQRFSALIDAREERNNPYTVHMDTVAPKPSGPSLLKRFFTP